MRINYVAGVYYATYRVHGDLRFIMAPTLSRAVALATFCLYRAAHAA